MKIHNDLELLG